MLLSLALVVSGCEGTTFQSSVPLYPVYAVIDTNIGEFVHFTTQGQYVIAIDNGYYMNGKWVAERSAMDAYGYGGVVVYYTYFGYKAFDLACPYCAQHGLRKSCEIDAMFAECPECGEQYDLLSGTAAPQKGIAREAMRAIPLTNSGGRLTIRQ